MRPHFYKVPVELQTSFSISHHIKPNFGTVWHYHPELELHYVIKGEGMRLIGDNISNFSSGEIILLGENLPHTWKCKEEYFEEQQNHEVEAIVIQFLPDCLGQDFLNLPEAYLIPRLYERAKKGLFFYGKTKEALADLMYAAIHTQNLDRLIILMSLLKTMAEAEDYTQIASAHAFYRFNEAETIRLNKIYNYTLSNYKKEITLEEIAAISNLSVTSFCRYFKVMTKRTYYDFLIEIRISHACRLLVEDRYPTELICFECGFNNVSNFYRHFKKVTGITPLEYKRKYLTNYAVAVR